MTIIPNCTGFKTYTYMTGKRFPHHLGGTAEGEAPDVSGDQVHPCVGHSDVARVCVHKTLVVHLQTQAIS